MLKNLKFAFFGTSLFAVTVLEVLKKAGLVPSILITTPDKPAGRNLLLMPSPAKKWAQAQNIPCFEPTKLETQSLSQNIEKNILVAMVASYGLIIPKDIINMFSHGILNIHPSLLPKYRGPSPIQTQILHNDKQVGVTIILLDEKMDHGPIVANKQIEISEISWPLSAPVLSECLAHQGGKLMAQIMPDWIAGKIKPQEQVHTLATYTKKIIKNNGLITKNEIEQKPYECILKIRAYEPWPGTFFFAQKQYKNIKCGVNKHIRVKIKDAVYENGMLKIIKVLPEGRNEIDYNLFLKSYNL
jgi:methionyl-tRNA formyltransferase